MGEYRLLSCDVAVSGDYTVEQLIDALPHYCPVNAHLEWNLDGLLEKIWDYLEFTRVYTKPRGVMPDFTEPVVLQKGKATVEHFCNRIHKTLINNFRHAVVWGTSAKHKPQR